MKRNNIPTARFSNFQDADQALNYLESIDYEIVIKVFYFLIFNSLFS